MTILVDQEAVDPEKKLIGRRQIREKKLIGSGAEDQKDSRRSGGDGRLAEDSGRPERAGGSGRSGGRVREFRGSGMIYERINFSFGELKFFFFFFFAVDECCCCCLLILGRNEKLNFCKTAHDF